jgi:DNA mismatch endonuclease, patch repair protein
MDTISKTRRSWIMSRIRSKNTKPEVLVRSLLHRKGYRFRLHVRNLPGRPDVVLPKWKTAVFVHGCFWHRHAHCPYAYTPKTRKAFWKKKFLANVRRDAKNLKALNELGWAAVVIWECELADPQKLEARLRSIKRRVPRAPAGLRHKAARPNSLA